MTWMDNDVKAVIAAAHDLASTDCRTVVGEEHLLVAILGTPPGARCLAPLTSAQARNVIFPAVRRARLGGGLTQADRAAIHDLGVDVASIEQRVDALDVGEAVARTPRPTGGWGQRMTDAAAVVMATAEDLAVARGVRVVGLGDVAAALVQVRSLVTEHLVAAGVTAHVVRARLEEGGES